MTIKYIYLIFKGSDLIKNAIDVPLEEIGGCFISMKIDGRFQSVVGSQMMIFLFRFEFVQKQRNQTNRLLS